MVKQCCKFTTCLELSWCKCLSERRSSWIYRIKTVKMTIIHLEESTWVALCVIDPGFAWACIILCKWKIVYKGWGLPKPSNPNLNFLWCMTEDPGILLITSSPCCRNLEVLRVVLSSYIEFHCCASRFHRSSTFWNYFLDQYFGLPHFVILGSILPHCKLSCFQRSVVWLFLSSIGMEFVWPRPLLPCRLAKFPSKALYLICCHEPLLGVVAKPLPELLTANCLVLYENFQGLRPERPLVRSFAMSTKTWSPGLVVLDHVLRFNMYLTKTRLLQSLELRHIACSSEHILAKTMSK